MSALFTKSADGVWCVELKDALDAGDSIAKKLPKDNAHLRITNKAGLTEIKCSGANCFLYKCSSLTSIDLAPLSMVTTIGYGFLWGCSSLTSIDLAPLSKVKVIGNDFLCGCISLTSIDLAPLSKVTTVESHFLCGCSSLTSIDLAPLSNVTTIGYGFLEGCSSLTSIDLAPLSNVIRIGDRFIDGCCSLRSITVEHWRDLAYTRLNESHKKNCGVLTAEAAAAKVAAAKAAAEKAAAEKAAAEKAAAAKVAAEKAAAEKAAAEKAAADKAAAEKAAAAKAAAEKAAAEKAAAEKAAAEKAAAAEAAGEKAAAEKAAAEKAVAEKAAAEKAAAEKAAAEKVVSRFMSSESAPPSIMPFDPLRSFPDFQAQSPCRNVVKDILLSGPSTLSLQSKERAVGEVLTIADMHASCVSEDVGAGCGQSFDEVFAIVAYTADVRGVGLPNEDNLFVRLNAVLRSRDPEACKPFMEYYFYLVNGLRKMPKVAVKTWRGIDKPVTSLSKLYGVGRLVSWPQFTSTSTNQKVMKQFAGKANGSLLQFSLTSAVSIRDWSLIPDEDEYLILPNTVLKVTTVVTAEQAKELEGFDGVSVGGGHYDLIAVRERE